MKRNLIKYGLGLSSLLFLSSSPLIAEDNITSIDALVIYSQGADDAYNGDAETRINHLFATTNKIYEDSGLKVELNAVKMQLFDLDDSASSNQILTETRQDAEINALRDTVGADEVLIYRPYANDDMCGLAYVNNGNEAYAYAHVTIDCAGYVTGHEVGHNMNLWHSARQDPNAGYARGHGVEDQFTTVMAYSQAYNGVKIYKFSDPDLDCNGEPCGIEVGLDDEADAVKEILIQAPLIANFREHIVIDDTNDTDDDNGTDDNNTDDNNTDTTDLDAAKKAYDDQLLVVNQSKVELKRLRADIRTQKNEARSTYKTKRSEAFTAYRESRAAAYATLKAGYSTLRTRYIDARKSYRARTISRADFIAIIKTIRAERKVLRATYREAVKAERAKLIETLKTLRAELRETINAARDAYKTYKTDVYLVEVEKLKALKKIYDDLVNAGA